MVLDPTDRSPEEELCADLCAVVTVFGARLHGMRRYKASKRGRSDDDPTADEAEEADGDDGGTDVRPPTKKKRKRKRRAPAAASAADPTVPHASTT